MGEVWKARDENLRRVIALKRIRRDRARNTDVPREANRRFLREAQLAARLRHRHIVSVHDFGEAHGEYYLTMDAIQGRSFDAYLAETVNAKRAVGAISPARLSEAVALLADVAEAVDFAHTQGVVHRDLKPSNCILDGAGQIYVLDFGLAKALRPDSGRAGEGPVDPTDLLTVAGQVAGTPRYMSPEQAHGIEGDGTSGEIGPASDIWSLGVMLYEVLTGCLPFDGKGLLTILAAIVGHPPAPPRRLNPHVSPDLEALCMLALEKEPDRRYRSAGELAHEMRRWLDDREPAAAVRGFCGEPVLTCIERYARQHEGGGVVLVFVQAIRRRVEEEGRKEVASYACLRSHEAEVVSKVARDLVVFEVSPGAEDGLVQARLLGFHRPSEAVRCALDLQAASISTAAAAGVSLALRVALHCWQPVSAAPEALHASLRAAIDLAGRLLSIAGEGQTLSSPAAFDRARTEMLRTEGPRVGGWFAHGSYILRGCHDPIEICAVAAQPGGDGGNGAIAAAPAATDAGRPAEVSAQEPGWRPGPGQVVPGTDWVLEAHLGQGSFDDVWSASDRLGRARRVFKFGFEVQNVDSLKRERDLLRRIQDGTQRHPNLVRLHEDHLEKAPYYLAMEDVEGASLRSWLMEADRILLLSVDAKCEIAAQVADALDAAATADVIHQDVNPEKILVDTSQPLDRAGAPRVKLIDFSVGRVAGEDVRRSRGFASPRVSLPMTGSRVTDSGTRLYMAPERLKDGTASPEGDLYSLGVVLYQMAVKDLKRPVTGDWNQEIFDSLLMQDLAGLLAGRPDARPSRGGQVAASLRARVRRRRDRRLRLVGYASMTVVGMVSVVMVVFWYHKHQLHLQIEQLKTENNKSNKNLKEALLQVTTEYVKLHQAVGSRRLALQTAVNSMQKGVSEELFRLAWKLHLQTDYSFVAVETPGAETESCSAISPQLMCVLSGDNHGNVRLMKLNTMEESVVQTGDKYAAGVQCVALSPDGKWVLWSSTYSKGEAMDATVGRFHYRSVTSDLDSAVGTIHYRSVTNDEDHLLQGHHGTVRCVAFSPDGSYALSGSADNTLRLWDLSTCQELRTLRGHTLEVSSIAFSSDGKLALSGSDDHTLRLWDLEHGNQTAQLVGHSERVTSVAFSPDGHQALSGSTDLTVRLWDLRNLREITSLKGHTDLVTSVAFSPDGLQALSGAGDHTVRLWDLGLREEAKRLEEHSERVVTVAFTKDGRTGLSASWDGRTHLWNLAGDRQVTRLQQQGETVIDFAFSRDGCWALFACSDGGVRLWDLENNRSMELFEGRAGGVLCIALSADGHKALSGHDDNSVRLWDLTSKVEIGRLVGHTGLIKAVAFSPDGTRALCGSDDGSARLWDLARSNEPVFLKGHIGTVTCVAFSPDGKQVLSGSDDCQVRLWDLSSPNKPLHTVRGPCPVRSLAFSPNGKQALSGFDDCTVRLWDLDNEACLGVFAGHKGRITSVAFRRSDSCTWAVSGSADGTVACWRLNDAQEEVRMDGLSSYGYLLTDGEHVAEVMLRNVLVYRDAPKYWQSWENAGHRNDLFEGWMNSRGLKMGQAEDAIVPRTEPGSAGK
ncbi:MAG: protein kinase [Planctomycetes bacterium]|nr:protein kinase [Planctomycetota bacterium]